MKIQRQPEIQSKQGFIYVASLQKRYYHYAVYSATTLKDFYPEAQVTLFTHENFLDKTSDIFDTVITDIPIYYRTKMWAMARTPYEKTIYIDADSFIAKKSIRNMHDLLDDCDIFFGPPTVYTVANFKWAYLDRKMTIVPKYHGGICGFNRNEKTIDFMQTWYDEYIKQVCNPEWPYDKDHDPKWKVFDMFTLWRMTNGLNSEFDRFKNINIKLIDKKYTACSAHKEEDRRDAVILQVDINTWKKIDFMNKFIEESAKNEIYPLKQYKINQVPQQFN